MPILEITTSIGCSVACSYCPQKNLVLNYNKNESVLKMMSMETFKSCLSKLDPRKVKIHFSGMAEPWLNPICSDMVLWAYENGFIVSVYTTLVGMKALDFERIRHIPFERFSLHLRDKEMKVKVTEEYLSLLRYIRESKVSNLSYGVFENLDQRIYEALGVDTIAIKEKNSRGTNLPDLITPKTRVEGKIRCGKGLNCNVLLPNGDVVVCCQDYSLDFVIGNLLKTKSYEGLFRSDAMKRLTKLQKDTKAEYLCRYCNYAVPA